eukprot:14388853-Heterocapsa_arctica.AAC.1
MPTVTAKATPLLMEAMRPRFLRPRATSSNTPRRRSKSYTPSCTPPARHHPYGGRKPWCLGRRRARGR